MLSPRDHSIGITIGQLRDFLFLSAVLAMNYTLMRPSPVDFVFLAAFCTAFLCNPRIRSNFLIFSVLTLTWLSSSVIASAHFLGDGEVQFELLTKTFVVVLGILTCFVASGWNDETLHRFLRVYVFSCFIGACIGIIGFIGGIEILLWDNRAKSFIDDPNMYAAFLAPGFLICIYMLRYRAQNKTIWRIAMCVLALGLLFSFSRAALGGLLVCSTVYAVFLNRGQPIRILLFLFCGSLFVGALMSVAYFAADDFSQKLVERLTFGMDYDVGRGGRYDNYFRAIPIIVENPIGLGVIQLDRIFLDPIHSIFVSSFVNYGWLGGFTWLIYFFGSIVLSLSNYRETRSPVPLLLMFCFVCVVMGAALHEGEHWRPLWLFGGLIWAFDPGRFSSTCAGHALGKAMRPARASPAMAIPERAAADRFAESRG